VEEGAVSAELLKSELARIIPVRWDWAVQEHGDKAFLVHFLSKVELDRMVAIRTVTTKNKEGVLIFEEFNSEVKPIKVLDQVWLSVTNVPTPLCVLLPLWAVGVSGRCYSEGGYESPSSYWRGPHSSGSI
jgi:hypothetical protein